MGASVNIQSDTTKQVISGYYSVVNDVVTTASANAKSTQTAITTVCPIKECGFTNGQDARLSCSIIGSVNNSQNTNIINQLDAGSMSDVIVMVKNSLTSVTRNYLDDVKKNFPAWFSVAINVVNDNHESEDSISSMIANSVSSNTNSVCSSEIAQTQESTILICGIVGANVNNVQNAFQANAMSCITKQIVNFASTNTVVRDAINAATLATENGSDSGNIIKYIVIAVLIIIIIVTIGYFFGGSSTPAPPPATRVAVPAKAPVKPRRPPAPLPKVKV
jgi:hypothetical protein